MTMVMVYDDDEGDDDDYDRVIYYCYTTITIIQVFSRGSMVKHG